MNKTVLLLGGIVMLLISFMQESDVFLSGAFMLITMGMSIAIKEIL
jgi:hypothetical protein